MKKSIIALFLTLSSFSVFAGNDQPKLATEASDIARRMASQIELNELEYIQVRSYTLEKLEMLANIQEMYVSNPEMLATKITDVETAYQYRIQNLLTNKQFENYLALNNRFKTQPNFIATSEK